MKAVFTGTFDPITNGHVDIIKRAATMFDELHVLLCINSEKKGMFVKEQREEMVKRACQGIDNVIVAVCEGLLTEYTEKNCISVIVRGVRDGNDLSYEASLATINRGLRNHPETVFLPSKPEYSHISSTYARDMIKYGEDLTDALPLSVIEYLKEIGMACNH